jgi:YD repeat-containing protein
MNDGSGDIEKFLADGKLGSITDANGNVVNLTYNNAGVLQQVTSETTGETITFTSNAQGLSPRLRIRTGRRSPMPITLPEHSC